MIALDSNLLIYAHRRDNEAYAAARAQLEALATGRALWAIPYPCVHEFIRNVTEPRLYADPTPLDLALEQVMTWHARSRACD